MDKVIELARTLGRQIAADERAISLKKAQEALNRDKDAQDLIKQYQTQAEKIHHLEQQQKPVEVEDKRKLQEIELKISQNENIKELTRRQADLVEMMNKVKETIDSELKKVE